MNILKKFLFKIGWGRFKCLVALLVGLSILLPAPAHALFGVGDFGLFDVFNNILDGIGERTASLFDVVVNIAIFYAGGLLALGVSTNLMETFVSKQAEWMISLGPMTQAGWNFTLGMSNMLMILIFIVIAFGFILKIEKIQAKKALPRLIGVAVLINFSWVFVKMLVDISQILYNTVLPPESSLFTAVMHVFFSASGSVLVQIESWMVSGAIAWAIPMASSFFQVVFATTFTVFLLPNVITWALQGFFFYLLSAMFFFFSFLFAARVFIIQILIILSPLAFLSMILDQTKSFWKQWFSTLLEWLLMGVYFLFFLNLGFGALGVLAPKSIATQNIPGINLLHTGDTLIYYFAIFIYMAVILLVGKQFMPKGAKALLDFAQGMVSTVATRGLKPLGRGFTGELTNAANKQRTYEQRMAAGLPIEEAGSFFGGNARMAGLEKWTRKRVEQGARWTRKRVEQGYRVAGAITGKPMSLDQSNIERTKKGEEEAKKINDPELLMRKAKEAHRKGDLNRELGLVTSGITAGKGFKKLFQQNGSMNKNDIFTLSSFAKSMNRQDKADVLARGFSKQLSDDDLGKITKFDPKTDVDKYGSAKAKLFATSKDEELEQFEEGAWRNPQGKMDKNVFKNIGGKQVGKLSNKFDSFADDINNYVDTVGGEEAIKQNYKVALYLAGSPAQAIEAGVRPFPGAEDAKSLTDKYKKGKTKEREDEKKKIDKFGVKYVGKPGEPSLGWTEKEGGIVVPGSQVPDEISKRLNDLKKYGQKYQSLKNNPNRSAKENLEYDSYLKKMEETARENEKYGDVAKLSSRTKEEILGEDTEEELSSFIAKQREELLRSLNSKGQNKKT